MEWDGEGRRPQPIEQPYLALAGAPGPVGQILPLHRVAIEHIVAVHMLELLQQRPLDLIFGDEN